MRPRARSHSNRIAFGCENATNIGQDKVNLLFAKLVRVPEK